VEGNKKKIIIKEGPRENVIDLGKPDFSDYKTVKGDYSEENKIWHLY
jgi:hypothetical protein